MVDMREKQCEATVMLTHATGVIITWVTRPNVMEKVSEGRGYLDSF